MISMDLEAIWGMSVGCRNPIFDPSKVEAGFWFDSKTVLRTKGTLCPLQAMPAAYEISGNLAGMWAFAHFLVQSRRGM